VPCGEQFGLPPERREGLLRMQQILDVVFAAVEVLAPGPEISSRIGPIASARNHDAIAGSSAG